MTAQRIDFVSVECGRTSFRNLVRTTMIPRTISGSSSRAPCLPLDKGLPYHPVLYFTYFLCIYTGIYESSYY